MAFRENLSKATGIDEKNLPTGYQIIGETILLKLPRIKSQAQKGKIADAIFSMFLYINTVCEISEVSGELRQPVVKLIKGAATETTHKENGLKFKLDVSKIMFSKGNLSERKRLIEQVRPGETIIDMFAGIGYFSLGIGKFSKAAKIISIEKNPEAYFYLKENINLNKITNITAMNEDCTKAASLNGTADRIIMGYFPNTERFLPSALEMAKPNCIIHFHNTYNKEELWDKPLSDIQEACNKAGFAPKVLAKKRVKSYAPNVFHAVIDFEVQKK